MSLSVTTDFLVIGAGVIGLTLANELKKQFPDASVTIIEKESAIGLHASGRNSGVLHAGFYYTADSLKARLCRDGNKALTEYCLERSLNINQCGKLVVATSEKELNTLDELFQRADQNQVVVESITEQEVNEIEPRAFTVDKALYSPTTSSVDPLQVINSFYKDALESGIKILFQHSYVNHADKVVTTSKGDIAAGYVVNTAGLYADKIAGDYGFSRDYTILPFKGLYLYTDKGSYDLKTHVYPVPDLDNPFLGVHFTVTVDGQTKIGPTAIPAFWRENYKGFEGINFRELAQIVNLESKLFINNAFNFRHLALSEIQKISRNKLIQLSSKLVNGIDDKHFTSWGRPGIRAQLVNTENNTLDMDFKFEGDEQSFHILNAVSPAFTCSIPFSKLLVKEINKILN